MSEATTGREASAEAWRIDPAPPSILGQIGALWRHRRLFWVFAVRALFNVYRNAILGITWMAVQPLAVAIPAVFIVRNILGVSVAPLPLPLFILAGIAFWVLFRRSLQWMTKSVAGSRSILERIYVPALLLMIAAVSPALFQFAVVLVLVAALAIYYGPIEGIYYVDLGWRALWAVPAMLLAILLAVGVACVTGILNVFARDTWLTMRYVLSGWMLATPILYPIEFIPEGYRWIAYLNPLAPAVELFRWALLGYGNVQWHYVALCVAEILALLIVGLRFFARQQTRIFDHA